MSARDYLPSKQFSLIAGSLILTGAVIGGGIWWMNRDKDAPLSSDNAVFAVQEIRKSREDTDGDGLLDWEEDLWDTEIGNIDTDGDGTNDGEEVKNNRDPRKAGPNDTISEFQKDLVYKIPTPTSRSNSTKQFFNSSLPEALILADKSLDGQALTQEEIDELVAPYALPDTVSVTTYSTQNLSIRGNTPDDLKTYSEDLKGVITTYQSLTGDELALVAEVMETGNINKLLTLRSTALRYEAFALDLSKVRVPSSLAATHLATVNWYASLSGAVLGMSESATDPLRGLVSIREYKTALTNAETSLAELLTALGDNAIQSVQ